jgi:CrcB protein
MGRHRKRCCAPVSERRYGSEVPSRPQPGALQPGALQPGALLAVALGGAAGGPARAGLSLAFPTHPGQFPWAILLINVLGALLIGVLLAIVPLLPSGGSRFRALTVTGFCGGFTTWSTFMVGADQLVARGHVPTALGYLAASVVAGLGAVTLGWIGTQKLTTRGVAA